MPEAMSGPSGLRDWGASIDSCAGRQVEVVSVGSVDYARALTNSERRNQRRRERGRKGSGTEAELAGQPWRDQTERRTETGSSSKDYAEDDAVNQRACKSVEGKELAPHRGRVSNLRGLPATGDQGDLPTDSDAHSSVISAVDSGGTRRPHWGMESLPDMPQQARSAGRSAAMLVYAGRLSAEHPLRSRPAGPPLQRLSMTIAFGFRRLPSCRNAGKGSIRSARRAGPSAAKKPITAMARATLASTNGSCGDA